MRSTLALAAQQLGRTADLHRYRRRSRAELSGAVPAQAPASGTECQPEAECERSHFRGEPPQLSLDHVGAVELSAVGRAERGIVRDPSGFHRHAGAMSKKTGVRLTMLAIWLCALVTASTTRRVLCCLATGTVQAVPAGAEVTLEFDPGPSTSWARTCSPTLFSRTLAASLSRSRKAATTGLKPQPALYSHSHR